MFWRFKIDFSSNHLQKVFLKDLSSKTKIKKKKKERNIRKIW